MRKSDAERWHAQIAIAGAMISTALARGRRQPDLMRQVCATLKGVTGEIDEQILAEQRKFKEISSNSPPHGRPAGRKRAARRRAG